MEFEFDCEDIFHLDGQGFVVLTGKELSSWKGFSSYTAGVRFEQGRKIFDKKDLDPFDKIAIVIDRIGAASSAVGQLLNTGSRNTTDHHYDGSIRRIRPEAILEGEFWKNRRDAESGEERIVLQGPGRKVYFYLSALRPGLLCA